MSQTGQPGAPRIGKCVPHVAGRPRLCIIAAVAANGVIGAGGKLPWQLSADLRFFRTQTLGHPVIMGRRTWESIGRPLPGRRNIVVSRSSDFRAEGAATAASLEAALAQCAGEETSFVIGGGDLYRAALPLADCLLLTEIRRDFDGDARFPEFDRQSWKEVSRERQTDADGLPFDFVRYERVR